MREAALHHLLTNGSSAVNGCHQNESPNRWQKYSNNPHHYSLSVMSCEKLCVCRKQIQAGSVIMDRGILSRNDGLMLKYLNGGFVSCDVLHLSDAFIQSDLQCIQAIHFLSVYVFPGNWTHNLCAANTMLYHWATGTSAVLTAIWTLILTAPIWGEYIFSKCSILVKYSFNNRDIIVN